MKKVLSIVLSLVMVLCMMPVMAFAATSNATYSDISGEKCEGAVNVLDALGVIDGYEDGTYRPDQVVTRAEMAKLIITALGMDSYATATTSSYSDMQNAQWAIPVVEYATNLGIVEGVGNGKFSPGNPVTYEQAVTMIVRAIGYTTDCNEMNGTWPAIYVQKATALGIFDDVEGNQYGTGANRGDVAIMLYNAIDLPQVYADKDGATHYKNGSEQFTVNGAAVNGVSMLSTLNKGGSYSYKVVDETDADNALTNMRSYVGVAGKVVTNKDGDVLAVSDTKSTLLTGSFDKDGKKFTAGDTTYNVDVTTALTKFENEGTKSSEINTGVDQVTKFTNGAENGTISDEIANYKDKSYTLSVKISGKTITQIWAVLEWTANDKDLFETVDASNIKNNSKLAGCNFLKNDNDEIDYTSFILEGVDSLDEIAEDNVVYVYADKNNNIRKVSVGTETVTGEWSKYTEGSATKAPVYTIDGKDYTAHAKGTYDKAITLDGASVGDTVTAYLDYSGKVYEFNLEEGYSDYAMVLRVAAGDSESSLNASNTAKIRVLTAKGEYTTLSVNKKELGTGTVDAATGALKLENNIELTPQDIIKYSTNSSGEVTKITEETLAPSADDKITSNGYFDGKAIVESAPIFVLTDEPDEDDIDSNPDDEVVAYTGYSDDIAKVYARSGMLNTKDIENASYYVKDGRIVVMRINDTDNTIGSSDAVYGVVTGVRVTSDDDYPTEITVLVGTEEQTYLYEGDAADVIRNTLVKITPNSDNKIADDKIVAADSLIGKVTATENPTETKNGVIGNYSYNSDAVVYEYDADENTWTVEYIDSVEAAKKDTVIGLYDNESKADDRDKVADIILVGDKVN